MESTIQSCGKVLKCNHIRKKYSILLQAFNLYTTSLYTSVQIKKGLVLTRRLTRLGSKDKVSEYELEWLDCIDSFYNEYEFTKTFLSEVNINKLCKIDESLERLMIDVTKCIEAYPEDRDVQNWQKKIQTSKKEYFTYSSYLSDELTGLRRI